MHNVASDKVCIMNLNLENDGYLEYAYNIYLSLDMKDLEQERWFRHESEWRLVEE